MNTYQDSFATDVTQIQGSGTYLSDSGNAYSFLPHLSTPVAIKTVSGSFYTASSGSGAIAVTNALLPVDAPASIRITIGASAPTQANNYVGPQIRVGGNGTSYACLVGSPSGALKFQLRSYSYNGSTTSGGTVTTVAAGAGNTQPAAGDYIFTVAPCGPVINLYWQRLSDGFYYNLSANAYQATKAPVLSWTDITWLQKSDTPYGPSNVGLFTQIGSADVNAWKVTLAQAGGNGIQLPGDVWVSRPSDTFVELFPFASEGGVSPVVHTIQRQQGAGAWSDVLIGVTPGRRCWDHGVSPATAYNYRLKTVDANSTTVTGASVSTTTLAAQSITPYTLGSGSMGQIANGVQFTDAAGTSRLMRDASWIWDERYGQYFLVCTNGISPTAILGFASADLMNWTPFGTLVDTTISAGLTNLNHPAIHPGADGNYYLTYSGSTTGSPSNAQLYVARSSAPMGPYAHFAIVGLPDGTNLISDGKVHLDLDGTPYYWGEGSTSGSCYFRPLKPDFTGWSTTPVVTVAGKLEGNATLRAGRSIIIFFNVPGSGWGAGTPGADAILGTSNPLFVQTWNQTTSLNANVSANPQFYPTPAQALSAPAGAGPTYYPTAGYTPPAAWGGSTTGIDPAYMYMSQCFWVGVTRTGQLIATATRYDAQGSPGADATSVPVWLPIVPNAGQMPTIPWASAVTPEASNPAGLRRRFIGGGVQAGFGRSQVA